MSARVVLGGLESDPFMVNVGVKQGCVLAPVIFNLFLVAITLLFRNRVLPADSVGINYRLDGSLFNIRRLQAATKVESTHVFELQYADDAALPSHTASGLQQKLDSLTDCYQRAGLVVNVNKTEVLAQVSAAQTSVTPTFSIAGSNLNNVHQFTYLGSILTEDCDLISEINYRIKLLAAAFGRLFQRVFLNHNLTVATKVSVYHAICLSIFLYGCESWTLYRRHVKPVEAHHIKCLQSILGVRWWHKVPHAEIRQMLTRNA